MAEEGNIFSRMHRQFSARNRSYPLLVAAAVLLVLLMGDLLSKVQLESPDTPRLFVEARVEANDEFLLYFLSAKKTEYNDLDTVKLNVQGKQEYQHLVFKLRDTLIRNIRLDLGNNSLQKTICIKRIYLACNGEQALLFDAERSINVFTANEFVSQSGERFQLNPPKSGIYDPYLVSSDISSEYARLAATKKRLPLPYFIAFITVLALLVYFLFFVQPKGFMPAFYAFASCFFLFLLLLPSINEHLQLYKNQNLEKRVLAQEPKFSLETLHEYPSQYEAYYNDNFGYRDLLVKWGGLVKSRLFHASAVPSRVMIGKEDWMFLSGEFYGVTQDLLKTNSFTKKQLEEEVEIWKRKLKELAQDSIHYYKAVWPDKHYIYPELMPFAMQVLNKDTLARCDQVIRYISEEHKELHLLDVREELRKQKASVKLYDKYDSHWNTLGAFVAYTALLNEIHKDLPGVKPLSLDAFNITWTEQGAGDLSQVLGLDLLEPKPVLVPKKDTFAIAALPAEGFPEKTQVFENKNALSSYTALVFRDSFTSALIPLLNRHFRKVVYIWDTPYSLNLVKQVKPDVVVEGYATRYFR